MMRRRAMVGRGGPGLVGTVARTAVIAGTASAVSHGVNRRMDAREAGKQEEQMAQEAAVQSQYEMEQMKAQMAALQAQQAQQAMAAQAAPAAAAPAPAAGGPDLMAQLQQLTQLKEAGALTDAEFAAAKAKLLG
jgi:hypothetical protein